MNSRFYQYQKMKDTRIKNLLNSQLFFNNPKKFDDPEDCKIHPYYEGTMETWINHYKQHPDYEHCPKFHEENLKKIIKEGIKNGFFQCNDGLISCDRGNTYDKNLPLVTCFCIKPDNAYMWRNYADDHTGFCLCFKANLRDPLEAHLYTLTIDSEIRTLIPVIYNVIPKTHLNLLDPNDVIMIGPRLITKNPNLANEKEHRIMIFGEPSLKNYNKEELEGIIFGSNADLKKEREIYNEARNIYEGLKFYKACYLKDSDTVKIKLIDEDYFKFLQ
jgi:hypothetical protein